MDTKTQIEDSLVGALKVINRQLDKLNNEIDKRFFSATSPYPSGCLMVALGQIELIKAEITKQIGQMEINAEKGK